MRNGYLVRRDPFREFDSLIRSAFEPVPTSFGQVAWPAVESRREGDDAVLRLELPGLDAEKDVTVELKGRLLVVSGERRDERVEEADDRRVSEFRYGSFRRSFRLAPHVTADDVTASYDAGVLTVRVTGAYAATEGHRVPVTTASPAAVEGTVTEGSEGTEG